MLGTKDVSQGKKGTGDGKRQVGVRMPQEVYSWIETGRGPRDTDTDRVLDAIYQQMDFESEAGPRLKELQAMATLEQISLGKMIARLALEAVDRRRKR